MVYALSDGSELACGMILPDIPAQAARMTGIMASGRRLALKTEKALCPGMSVCQ